MKILLTAMVILILSACSSQNYDANMITNGELLYAENCLSCHGKNLQGQQNWLNTLDEDGHRLAPPLNGSGHTWHHPPEMLSQIIKYGLILGPLHKINLLFLLSYINLSVKLLFIISLTLYLTLLI